MRGASVFWSRGLAGPSAQLIARGPFDTANTKPAANLLLFAHRLREGQVRVYFGCSGPTEQ